MSGDGEGLWQHRHSGNYYIVISLVNYLKNRFLGALYISVPPLRTILPFPSRQNLCLLFFFLFLTFQVQLVLLMSSRMCGPAIECIVTYKQKHLQQTPLLPCCQLPMTPGVGAGLHVCMSSTLAWLGFSLHGACAWSQL